MYFFKVQYFHLASSNFENAQCVYVFLITIVCFSSGQKNMHFSSGEKNMHFFIRAENGTVGGDSSPFFKFLLWKNVEFSSVKKKSLFVRPGEKCWFLYAENIHFSAETENAYFSALTKNADLCSLQNNIFSAECIL